MRARKFSCLVLESRWLTPHVLGLRFKPSRSFPYDGGQFLSVVIPESFTASGRSVKRAYSFASSFADDAYELCVNILPGGIGSSYLQQLKPGDAFEIFAPYGEFRYRPAPGRSACLIATGTGIAPFRSMVRSASFLEQPPRACRLIFGARSQREILYPGFFEEQGIEAIIALSQPEPGWNGFHGRVTDYLRTLPAHWQWRTTDFYLCGNAPMVEEVHEILVGCGVSDSAIHSEIFVPANARKIAA